MLLLAAGLLFSQNTPTAGQKSVTVPITLDHDRIVIDVYLPLPNGTTKRVRGWVDNGNPDLTMSRNVATLMGLKISCGDKQCTAPPPPAIAIEGMRIPLTAVKTVRIPLKTPSAAEIMAPGMSAEINLPSTVLRNYEVLVNFPEREFTIAEPGTMKFNGIDTKIVINPDNGLIHLISELENKKCNLALDLGSSISFLSQDIFERLAMKNPAWPRMTGAIGPANMWGSSEEAHGEVMRIEGIQFGSIFLSGVPVVSTPPDVMTWLEKRAGLPVAGILGGQALLNYRIGLDYAHSKVYFDIGSTFRFSEFNVIGLTLRPEDDGQYTIIGVPDFAGKPSVDGVQPGDHLVAVDSTPVAGSTMGQVWSLLEGQPGQERKLTIERAGKQFTINAPVEPFLAAGPEGKESRSSSRW